MIIRFCQTNLTITSTAFISSATQQEINSHHTIMSDTIHTNGNLSISNNCYDGLMSDMKSVLPSITFGGTIAAVKTSSVVIDNRQFDSSYICKILWRCSIRQKFTSICFSQCI